MRLAAITVVGGAYSRAGGEPEPAAIVRALDALSIRGINYYPAKTPWGGLWTNTPPEVIERDMALMASLHINVVRTFIPCSTGTQAAKLTDADGNVSPAYLERSTSFWRLPGNRGFARFSASTSTKKRWRRPRARCGGPRSAPSWADTEPTVAC